MPFRRSFLFAAALILTLPLLADSAVPFSSPRRTVTPVLRLPMPNVKVASNGSDFLVAWSGMDISREPFAESFAVEPQIFPSFCRIYAKRYNAGGSTSEVASIPITDRIFPDPTVANFTLSRAGEGYLATWPPVAAFLDTNGAVQRKITLPFDVWAAATSGSLHLLVGASEGILLDDSGMTVASHIAIDTQGCNLPGGCRSPFLDVEGDTGGGFLVVMGRNAGDGAHIYARRISRTGAITNWFEVAARTGASLNNLYVVSEPAHERVVWADWSKTNNVSTTSTLTVTIDSQTNAVGSVSTVGAGTSKLLDAVRAGNMTWLLFDSPRRIMAVDNGQQAPIDLPGDMRFPLKLATDGQRLLYVEAALAIEENPKPTAVFPSVSASIVWPASAQSQIISRIEAVQDDGSIVAAGDRTLALWSEADPGGRTLFAARFGSDGAALDPLGIVISSRGINHTAEAAFNGVDWLVTWRRHNGLAEQIVARRLSTQGRLVGNEIVLGSSWAPPWLSALNYMPGPRLTSDGNNWLVAWIEPPTWTSLPDPAQPHWQPMRAVVRRVAASGVLLDPDPRPVGTASQIPADQIAQGSIDVTWNGSNYVAVWDEGLQLRNDTNPVTYTVDRGRIAGTVLARDLGTIGNPFFISGVPSVPAEYASFPRVVANSTRMFVTWWCMSNDWTGYAVTALPISSSRKRAVRMHVADQSVSSLLRGTPVGSAVLSSGDFVLTRAATLTDPDDKDKSVRRVIVDRFSQNGDGPRSTTLPLPSAWWWEMMPLRGITASEWTVTIPVMDSNDRAWLRSYDTSTSAPRLTAAKDGR